MTPTTLRVNGRRLRESLEEMAKIGGTPGGGVHRLSLGDEDRRARDLFVSWLRELDLEIIVDEMGNIFGRRPGRDTSLPAVMSGSHVDSQPFGGRFDGILGVMGPLEVLRTLAENDIQTERPIVIADWTNEEGSRFSPAMVGSGVWAGALDRDYVHGRADKNGHTFGQELSRIGYKGNSPCRAFPVHAYFEYHIEQGPILERVGKTIGLPKGIVCLHWYDVAVIGEANQVGPTPMEGRRDALCAAAEMILAVNNLPRRLGQDLRATVGNIANHPNSRNIVPGRVDFTVDIRSYDDEFALAAWDELVSDLRDISERWGCPMEPRVTWRVGRQPFDQRLVEIIHDTAEGLGFSTHPMVSGAGHDASYVNQVFPTAMIFVPSIGGRSHVEVERTTWEDCQAGADVLLHCLLRTANEK